MSEEFAKERMAICESCPLYKIDKRYGWPVCNPNAYVNPETNEISYTRKPGYFKGCGCKLTSLTSHKLNHCHAGKW